MAELLLRKHRYQELYEDNAKKVARKADRAKAMLQEASKECTFKPQRIAKKTSPSKTSPTKGASAESATEAAADSEAKADAKADAKAGTKAARDEEVFERLVKRGKEQRRKR